VRLLLDHELDALHALRIDSKRVALSEAEQAALRKK